MSSDYRLPTGNGDIEATYWSTRGGGDYWESVDDPIGETDGNTTTCTNNYFADTARYCLFTFSGFNIPEGAVIDSVVITTTSRVRWVPPI